MTSVVLDASAVLAFARGEPGSEAVRDALHGALISAVNFAEYLKKSSEHGVPVETASAHLTRSGVRVVPFEAAHAESSAALWKSSRHLGLSLGDRACLALAIAQSASVLTTDRQMAKADVPVAIVLLRGGH